MFMEAYCRWRLERKIRSLKPPPAGDGMDRENAEKLIEVVSEQHGVLFTRPKTGNKVLRAQVKVEAELRLRQALIAYMSNVVMRPRNETNAPFAEFHRTVEKVVQTIERLALYRE